MKKEIFIFVAIFIMLSLSMHMTQWVSHPIEHFEHLLTHSMPYHPLLYTIVFYLLIAILRFIVASIMKLFHTKEGF